MGAQPSPGSYPGNASLPREVKEKILSTFRHTLNLYSEGKLEDCLIGCDFILKMDARFAPARQLMEKARNPNAEIDVSQLEAIVASTPTRQERGAGADVDRLLIRAVESFNARDFDAAIAAAEQVLAVAPGSPDALEILDKSEQKKAAEPVFDGCRRRALAALEANRTADARRELEQMRGLDPDHPAVALLERRIGAASPGAGAAPKPPPPPDFGGLSLDLPDTGSGVGGGFATQEPSIGFEEGKDAAWNTPAHPRAAAPPVPPAPGAGGLDALSLDSLSLDLPASVEPMTPPASGRRTELGGPLHDSRPASPPGSPADMWGDAGGGLNLGDVDFGPRADSPGLGESAPVSGPTAIPGLGPDPQEESDASEREIAALLGQGDDAAARGDRQQAIEIWSRIFLIDINNTEAVTRIENTRQHMAEGNRRISDSLTAGREAYEMGNLQGARELFQQVVGVDPHEPTALFYLDRIQEDMSRPAGPAARGSEAPPVPPGSATAPAAVPAEPEAPAAPPKGKPFGLPVHPRVLILVGAFVAITLLLAYVFVFRAPRAAAPVPGAKAASVGSLPRARQLLGEGKIAEARQELREIPASSPDYAQAQRTLADLGKSPASAAAPKAGGGVSVLPQEGTATSAAPTDAQADAARIRLVAERALAEKRYIEALKNFSQASLAFRNDPTFAQAMGVAAEKVTALTPAVKLYNEREYETAIPVLWRIFQEDRENQDAKTYLLRAYYNQGITQLQNGQYPKAIQSFQEALSLDPADAEAIRHRKFAERYQKGDLDLMGRIYVRHLNHRP
ncbi:MAG TPA: tetratricopeptide repeat protein [Thermoanaerobaculia bacterium]|nr:tetratricopeptide repeat protein [Thermoanaerobaculia bacterium]